MLLVKPRNSRVTVRLPDKALAKLDKIAKQVAPKGTKPNNSVAIRLLIEKEQL